MWVSRFLFWDKFGTKWKLKLKIKTIFPQIHLNEKTKQNCEPYLCLVTGIKRIVLNE